MGRLHAYTGKALVDRVDHQDDDADSILKPREYAPASLFTHIDANKDGVVTLPEYQAIYAPHFSARDRNADGKLTADEIWTAP